MFQKLFGQRSLLISIYEPREQRVENLCRKIASSKNSSDPDAHREIAEDLIDTDQKERSDFLGQRLEDVFQRADVFLKVGTSFREDARRFIQLLFQAPYITPTVDELLMFQARATAQRSADLSRQVGAVIATKTGEILATGCNEVPRAPERRLLPNCLKPLQRPDGSRRINPPARQKTALKMPCTSTRSPWQARR
jgi:cytidine deaminase